MDVEQVADLPDTSRMTKAERLAVLEKVIDEMRAAARAAGLTDEDVDAELLAWKAERRSRRVGFSPPCALGRRVSTAATLGALILWPASSWCSDLARGDYRSFCPEKRSFPVFDCHLRSGDTVALCLREGSLTKYLHFERTRGKSFSEPVLNAEQSSHIARDSETLLVTTAREHVTIFIDDAPADNVYPILSFEKHGVRQDEPCTNDGTSDGREVEIHGAKVSVTSFSLATAGLVTLTDEDPQPPVTKFLQRHNTTPSGRTPQP